MLIPWDAAFTVEERNRTDNNTARIDGADVDALDVIIFICIIDCTVICGVV